MSTPQDIQSQPQHNYFLVIPAFITDDPLVDDSTAILFGRLIALSNQKGYCWASDKYLAELTRTSERELQRRLKTLCDLGYVRRHTEKKGFSWSRKLTPVTFKENIATRQPRRLDSASLGDSIPPTMAEEYDKPTSISEYDNDRATPCVDRSADIRQDIVSFDPDTYRLPNGKALSLRFIRSLKKYSDKERIKLLANIEYFEQKMKTKDSVDNQEAYLQTCIKNDYAGKETSAWQNKIYAEIMQGESKVYQMKILKTCVQFYKDGILRESISLNLPEATFSNIVENYCNQKC